MQESKTVLSGLILGYSYLLLWIGTYNYCSRYDKLFGSGRSKIICRHRLDGPDPRDLRRRQIQGRGIIQLVHTEGGRVAPGQRVDEVPGQDLQPGTKAAVGRGTW
jgi:hypothetical protein